MSKGRARINHSPMGKPNRAVSNSAMNGPPPKGHEGVTGLGPSLNPATDVNPNQPIGADVMKVLEELPPKHNHRGDADSFVVRSAQSLVDQNLYEFTRWLRARLDDPTITDVKNSEKVLLRGFFTYIRRALHKAVCAQTWHMLSKLMSEIESLSKDDKAAIQRMAERLSAPDMKDTVVRELAVDADDLENVTASEIAKAFNKMFGKKVTREILHEFVEQSAFIRDNLYRMGFP